jgi:hypothetical protein
LTLSSLLDAVDGGRLSPVDRPRGIEYSAKLTSEAALALPQSAQLNSSHSLAGVDFG